MLVSGSTNIPLTQWLVEFPAGPLGFGERTVDHRSIGLLQTEHGALRVITPTLCVIDRLLAYHHWSDPQSWDQAILVCKNNLSLGRHCTLGQKWAGISRDREIACRGRFDIMTIPKELAERRRCGSSKIHPCKNQAKAMGCHLAEGARPEHGQLIE